MGGRGVRATAPKLGEAERSDTTRPGLRGRDASFGDPLLAARHHEDGGFKGAGRPLAVCAQMLHVATDGRRRGLTVDAAHPVTSRDIVEYVGGTALTKFGSEATPVLFVRRCYMWQRMVDAVV